MKDSGKVSGFPSKCAGPLLLCYLSLFSVESFDDKIYFSLFRFLPDFVDYLADSGRARLSVLTRVRQQIHVRNFKLRKKTKTKKKCKKNGPDVADGNPPIIMCDSLVR